MSDAAELITALGTIIGLLALAVKLLLNSYFKKSHELEEVKKKHSDKTQDRLDKELSTLDMLFKELKETVRLLTQKLDHTDKRVDQLVMELHNTAKMVEDFQNSASDKIKNMIKSEVVDLTKQLAMIRSKKQ